MPRALLSLTSLEPCSSYLASRAQASKQASARSRALACAVRPWKETTAAGPGRALVSRATQAPGPWKQARFPNRPTIESMPRGYGHDQVAFCTWQAPICSFGEPLSPLLVHFMSIRTPLFFFWVFSFFWGGFPPHPPTPLFPSVYLWT